VTSFITNIPESVEHGDSGLLLPPSNPPHVQHNSIRRPVMLINLLKSLELAHDNAAASDPRADSLGENLVYSRSEIEKALLQLQQGQVPVMLLCAGQTTPLMSLIVHVDRERDCILLKQVSNDGDHALILEQDFFNLCGQVNGCPAIMSIRLDAMETHQGAQCYRIPIPKWMLSSRLRDAVRMRLRPSEPTTLSFTTGDHVQAKGWICNLSEDGVAFYVDGDEAHTMSPGQSLTPVSMQLAREEFSGLSLEVKHVSRTDSGKYLVGARLTQLSETLRESLRRYLLMLQRDSARLA
jgi:c-di-GMP-binding flagellar brake protein YcgR